MSHDTITLLSSNRRDVTVDGQPFTVELDDVGLLRDLMALNERISTTTTDSKDVRATLAKLVALADDAKAVIERALGTGSYTALFGEDKQSLVRALFLVSSLTKVAGESYDAMFAEYKPEP